MKFSLPKKKGGKAYVFSEKTGTLYELDGKKMIAHRWIKKRGD